jgi:short-subunit dehydrogenase
MKNVALITGASSGIGMEFARIHASKGGDLVLIARREKELKDIQSELTSTHNISCKTIAIDLTDSDAIGNIQTFLHENMIEIDILINNAGFGGHGLFAERDLATDEKMIRLNTLALTSLTHCILQNMRERRKGRILNVASVAGFLPGPLQTTYFATKAYVVSFSQGLAREVKPLGISVTTLCPGPVHTGFEKTAGLDGANLFRSAVDAHSTARKGYDGMMKGKLLVFNQKRFSFLIRFVVPFLPDAWKAAMVQSMQTK